MYPTISLLYSIVYRGHKTSQWLLLPQGSGHARADHVSHLKARKPMEIGLSVDDLPIINACDCPFHVYIYINV